MSQIIIGFTTEGRTDLRLLESIIQRTFVAVGMECQSQIEVIDPIIKVDKELGETFVTQMSNCAVKAYEQGIMAYCIHADSDADNDATVIKDKIQPLIDKIANFGGIGICRNVIPIIPIYMSEAWMLADKELLKEEIGTTKSDIELGINRDPEDYRDPKATIEEAIRIACAGFTKRRRGTLTISELYQPIGQKIDLLKLENLRSYLKFKEATRDAYRNLNYLQ